jgi:hypothetical protein
LHLSSFIQNNLWVIVAKQRQVVQWLNTIIQHFEHTMTGLHEKIRKIIQQRNLSVRQASELCGVRYTTFRTQIVDKREIPFSTVVAFSEAFGIPLDYFTDKLPSLDFLTEDQGDTISQLVARNANSHIETAARSASQKGARVTLKGFLDWWAINSGRLENFDQISESVDLFQVPNSDSNQIRPLQIGRNSLATKHFDLEETQHLTQTLEGFTSETNNKLIQAHLEAFNRGEPVITHPFLDETLRDGQRFARRYRRVMAPIYLPKGKTLLVNYSEDF